jgi:nucleoside phosphorylase
MVRFAIVVATDEELQAVRQVFHIRNSEFYPTDNTYYYFSVVPAVNQSGEHEVVIAQQVHKGQHPAHELALNLAKRWKPRYLILVGTVGGIPGGQQVTLGDVVVPTDVNYYELQKVTARKTEYRRMPTLPPSVRLHAVVNSIRALGVDWWAPIVRSRPDTSGVRPAVVGGVLLSGDKLLGKKSYPPIAELVRRDSTIVAIDMEAAGVGRALLETAEEGFTAFFVIKGVSDLVGTSDQSVRDTWTPYAAQVAATFARTIIERFPSSLQSTSVTRIPGPTPVPRRLSKTIGLNLRSLEVLKGHEMTDPIHLDRLMAEILRDGYQRDPIIVDDRTNVIIDGHHRVEIFKRIGLRKIAVFPTDYFSTRIMIINSWVPTFTAEPRVIAGVLGSELGKDATVASSSDNALVWTDGRLNLTLERGSIMETLIGLFDIVYAPNEETAREMLNSRKARAYLIMSPVTKQDVMWAAFSYRLLPPKTTLHVFPFRPKPVFVPLDLLRSDKEDFG